MDSTPTSDTRTIGQKVYDFLIVNDWLDLSLGVGLWFSSFFFFTLTFIVSAYMFVKAFMLLLGNYLKGRMASSARVVINTDDDSLTVGRLTDFAYATLIAFFLLSLINIPIIGTLLTMIPYVKTLIFTLIVIAGSPVKPFLNVIGTFIQPKSNLFLSIMNFSVAESIVYLVQPEHYNDLMFQAASLNLSIFSQVGSDILGMCFDKLLGSPFVVSQSPDVKNQLTVLKAKLVDPNNLLKFVSNYSQIQTVLSDLTQVSGTTMSDDQKLSLLTKSINTLNQILA